MALLLIITLNVNRKNLNYFLIYGLLLFKCYLKACSVLHVFGFMVQDILKRMVLFCKAAVEVHWLNAHMYSQISKCCFTFLKHLICAVDIISVHRNRYRLQGPDV